MFSLVEAVWLGAVSMYEAGTLNVVREKGTGSREDRVSFFINWPYIFLQLVTNFVRAAGDHLVIPFDQLGHA